MYLSEYFTLEELTFSQLAIRKRLDNTPSDAAFEALRALCLNVLDPLRTHLGRPLQVTSGYRSGPVNAALGAALGSAHARGQAADLVCPGISAHELFHEVLRAGVPFDRLILEGGWVHVSFDAARKRQRGQILVAEFAADGTRYVELDRSAALAA